MAKTIREQTPNAEDRVGSMTGGEVLCTSLIAWLREGNDSLEVSQKVVEMVWPRACAGWPQTQQFWKSEGATKLELLSEIETALRKGGARCQQHLTRLGYYCPHCQHGSCTVCNDQEGRIQCPRCQTPFPHMTPVHRRECCLLVLNLVSSAPATGTHPCLRTPMPQLACSGRTMDRGSVGRRHRAEPPGRQP